MADNLSYKITPKTVIEDKLRFRIPLYQRLFAWKSPEVTQLLMDLHHHFIKPITDNKIEVINKAYYLGMLTVVKQGGYLDLIDGQQRTTVLTLLSIAFIKTLEDGETKKLWTNFFDSANRLYFNGRSEDREFLSYLAKPEVKQLSYKNKNMEDGLSVIEAYFKMNFDSDGLEVFASQVYNYLTIFITELPSHYVETPTSLNEYFEAMNSSGKSLEQHEILKVELLRDYTKSDKLALTKLWNAVADFEKPLIKLVDSHIDRTEQIKQYLDNIRLCRQKNFDESIAALCSGERNYSTRKSIAEIEVAKHEFGDKTPRDKEDAVISFPQFLLIVLALHKGKDEIAHIHPSKLHDTFNNANFRLTAEEIGQFYHELLFYRLLMDMYVTRMKYSSSSSSHILISRNTDDIDQEEHAHERLRQFEAMLDVSTEPHIWLLPLLKHLRDLDHEPTQMELLKFLMTLDYNRKNHSECPHLDYLDYDSKPRYWLWRTDYAIWEKLILDKDAYKGYVNIDAEAIRQYEFRTNRSIEHLHPQNQDNNDEWSRTDVNSFGNLAMISQSFNSQQSNLPVHVKFANLEVQIGNKALQSLKLYFMYLKAKGSDAEWTVTAKDAHAEEMRKILNESLEKVKGYGQREF